VFAPGTTPPSLVTHINALLRQAVGASETREQLRVQGVTPQLLSPDQFREKVKSEIDQWAPVITKSGMKGAL
jgi:tripartite-type tricarboxylate transporter receptor subunit TctC